MRVGEYQVRHDGMCWMLWRTSSKSDVTYWSTLPQVAEALADLTAVDAFKVCSTWDDLESALLERLEQLEALSKPPEGRAGP